MVTGLSYSHETTTKCFENHSGSMKLFELVFIVGSMWLIILGKITFLPWSLRRNSLLRLTHWTRKSNGSHRFGDFRRHPTFFIPYFLHPVGKINIRELHEFWWFCSVLHNTHLDKLKNIDIQVQALFCSHIWFIQRDQADIFYFLSSNSSVSSLLLEFHLVSKIFLNMIKCGNGVETLYVLYSCRARSCMPEVKSNQNVSLKCFPIVVKFTVT